MIAATADQSIGIKWYDGSFETTNATGIAIGTGSVNTNTIITSEGGTPTDYYAAGLARAYNGGG